MNAVRILAVLLLAFAGCSTAYMTSRAPFPRSEKVAVYSVEQVRESVIEQDEFWKRPPATNVLRFKRFPSPQEMQKIVSHFQDGDTVIEFKDSDWSVGIDHMSSGAERAFCVVRDGRIISTVKI
jgi:uncharacterized protein (DUF1697 family)